MERVGVGISGYKGGRRGGDGAGASPPDRQLNRDDGAIAAPNMTFGRHRSDVPPIAILSPTKWMQYII